MRIGDGTNKYAAITGNNEIKTKDTDLATAIGLQAKLTDTQPVSIQGTVPLPTGSATEAKQDAQIVLLGAVTETAPASDTASSGLNGRLQRIAQRISSLIALFPASLGQKTMANSFAVTVASDQSAVPVSGTVTANLGTLNGAATETTLAAMSAKLPATLGAKAAAASLAVTQSTEDVARMGIITETAPASDTASSGLNGRLQRIAQRLTSLIALLPSSLGAKTGANSLSVVPATDAVFGTSSTPQGTSTFSTQAVTESAVTTFTVPAGAKRMIVYNNAGGTVANRIRRGNVAVAPSWTGAGVGPILGVGSFTSEMPATTFTCIAENADSNANVSVEYFY